MNVPPPIIAALRALDDLSPLCVRYPWGTVTRSPSVPRVHDANHAWIVDASSLSLAELRDAITSAQAEAPVPYTHVEVVDVEAWPQLIAELTAWLGPPPDVFVLMAGSSVHPGEVQPPSPGMTVTEQQFPDFERWLALIRAGHDDQPQLPEDVLRQLAARDTSVFVPAGRRFFAAETDGEVIGYASLLSVEGVGLIDNVATLPAHRRRGVATAVVGAAAAASVAARNEHTILFTHTGSAAQRVYERLGMHVVAGAAQFHSDQAADF